MSRYGTYAITLVLLVIVAAITAFFPPATLAKLG